MSAYKKICDSHYCCVVVAHDDAAADTGQRHRRGADGKKIPHDFHLKNQIIS